MLELSLTNLPVLLVIVLGLSIGGIVKGATGVGLPVVAIPVIAAFSDVQTAVIVIVIPNMITNLQLLWTWRRETTSVGITRRLILSGIVGAAIGAWGLVTMPDDALRLAMAGIIIVFIAMRLFRPDARIPAAIADRLALLAGSVGGLLQGALGISSPAVVTFLNALGLPRPAFIYTVASFFAVMSIPQLIVFISYGLIDAHVVLLGLLAMIPLTASLLLGNRMGKHLSPLGFNRVILVLLSVLAARQIWHVIYF